LVSNGGCAVQHAQQLNRPPLWHSTKHIFRGTGGRCCGCCSAVGGSVTCRGCLRHKGAGAVSIQVALCQCPTVQYTLQPTRQQQHQPTHQQQHCWRLLVGCVGRRGLQGSVCVCGGGHKGWGFQRYTADVLCSTHNSPIIIHSTRHIARGTCGAYCS
jgi:hypothetical protein